METTTSETTVKKIESEWDGKPIPMPRWGKDHWSTLAYIETRCVDHKGKPHAPHMRTEPGRPIRGHFRTDTDGAEMFAPHDGGSKRYPTRLNDGHDIFGHDDWACAADMEVSGLLLWEGTGMYPVFKLTPLGAKVASLLRQHMAASLPSARFMPPVEIMAEIAMATTTTTPEAKVRFQVGGEAALALDLSPPAVDDVFEISHSRKGTFSFRITGHDEEWVTGIVVDGVAQALGRDNVREEGEEVTVRRSHVTRWKRLKKAV